MPLALSIAVYSALLNTSERVKVSPMNGIVLVDFKTDALKKGIWELADRYRVQLDWYEKALVRLTGRKVVQKYIYSFAADDVLAL